MITPLPIIGNLNDDDMQNIRASKNRVFDGLVQPCGPDGHGRVLVVGGRVEPPPGATYYYVDATWHEGLDRQLSKVLNGDPEFEADVLNIQFYLGAE